RRQRQMCIRDRIYLIRSNYTRIVSLFFWIIVDILLWGFLTHYLNHINKSEVNFVTLLLGAVLFWDFFNRIMYGVVMGFLEDVWARSFVNLFCSPILLKEYLAGLILSSLIVGSIALGIMVFIACFIFGLSFLAYGWVALFSLIILLLFGISFGILAISIMLRFGPSAEWLIWPLPAVLAPFVGIFYPVEILPSWMQGISRVLPASYVFESLRQVVLRQTLNYTHLGISFILVCGYLAFFSWLFYLIYIDTLKSGRIARYSAENIS
ncbi:MAG: ABC transporter permease, partial [Candidatus Omnitrophica bacterium]|nr:ABC transporter permease [Candidatus Omnitrophota bacterium]